MNKKIIQILFVLCTTNIITACNSGGTPKSNNSNHFELKGGLFSSAQSTPTISKFEVMVNGSTRIDYLPNESNEWNSDFYNKISQSKHPVHLTIHGLNPDAVKKLVATSLPENVYALHLYHSRTDNFVDPNNLKPQDLKAIAPLLENITDFAYVLHSHRYSLENDVLETLIKSMPELDTLRLEHNWIGVKGLKTIVKSTNAKNLKSLSLKNESIDDYGASVIYNSFPALTKLDLSSNNITYNGFVKIANNLKSLKILNLSHNEKVLQINNISNYQRNNYQSITNLSLNDLHFENQWMSPRKLKYILNSFPNLSSLSLSSCGMDEKYIPAIVQSSPNLTYLDVSWNKDMSNDSIKYMIKKLPKLDYIDLYSVNYGYNLNAPWRLKIRTLHNPMTK